MKTARCLIWKILEKIDNLLVAFWDALTGEAKPFVVSAAESAIRADSPHFSQRAAFSTNDSEDGYLTLVENGLNRRMTLSKSVTTVGAATADYRLANSGEDYLKFVKRDNRYYVQGHDCGSSVRLNGQTLSSDEMIELKPRDAIQFARTTLTFFLPEASPKRTGANGKEAEHE